MTETKRPRTLAERLLAPVADVRQAEVAGVLLMALTMLLLLAAYYMLKTVREALILTRGGAEVKTYSSAAQALLLLFILPVFSAVASRVNRARLLTMVTLSFVASLVLFIVVGQSSTVVGIIYFLWVGLFSVMVIAQFWAFANDLYTPEQGKRLFPVIGVGSSLGAWLGSRWASRIISAIGPFPLMVVAGVIVCLCIALAVYVNRRQRPVAVAHAAASSDAPLSKDGPIEIIRRDRYLVYIALLAIVVNIATTSSDYLVGRFLVERADALYGTDPANLEAKERFVGSTYGRLYGYINVVGFLTQLLLVSRIFKYIGVVNALFVHPLIALAGNLMMVGRPSIRTMAIFKVADSSSDYSVDSTARQALWLPTSREAKYKAKQAIDSFFVRFGDMVQAGIVYVGTALSFSIQAFAAVNLLLVVAWLVIVVRLRQLYRQRVDVPSQRAA